MSPRARQAASVVVLAVLLVVGAQRPGAFLAGGERPEPFPADLVVAAPPAPAIYDDRPDIRILQLADSMDAMWARAFAAAGDEYEPAIVETRALGRETGCGDSRPEWAGIYCHDQRKIVVDLDSHPWLRDAVGDDGSDDRLGYVLAHEMGHRVQALRGVLLVSSERVLRAELHAECLAGVWGHAAGRPPQPLWTYSPDAEHGTVAQQQRWFEVGHRAGRPAACDAVWTDATP